MEHSAPGASDRNTWKARRELRLMKYQNLSSVIQQSDLVRYRSQKWKQIRTAAYSHLVMYHIQITGFCYENKHHVLFCLHIDS